MRKLIFVLALISAPAFSEHNDFGKSDRGTNFTPNDLRGRLQIDGDIIVSSPDGSRFLFRAGEFRTWHFRDGANNVLSNWNYETVDGSVKMRLRHEWTVGDDGVIRVHFQQYDSMEPMPDGGVKVGKVIREDTVTVKDFAPVTWTVSTDANQRVVARFHLTLSGSHDYRDVSFVPVSIDDGILTDSKDRLWAEGLNGAEGKYLAISTYLGTIALSYYPFEGASLIGSAEGNVITINSGETKIKLRSARPFVVGKGVRVYGFVDAAKKSRKRGSVHIDDSDDEKEFKQFLKEL